MILSAIEPIDFPIEDVGETVNINSAELFCDDIKPMFINPPIVIIYDSGIKNLPLDYHPY